MDVRNVPKSEHGPQKMMMSSSSSSSSCGLCFGKINPTRIPQNKTQSPIFNSSTSLPSPSNCNLGKPTSLNHNNHLAIQPSRRRILSLSILTTLISSTASLSSSKPSWSGTEESIELERYTDINEGFTLLRPTSWIKVEKAGATVLFEDPSKGANNVGVVVTPVRLTSLREFGDPQFVSRKLIQTEKRKESTKDAQVISFAERPGQNGDVQVYEFEYKIDSTRGGLKRIFSAAFVASKKLYLLNIAHSDGPQLDNHRRMMLEQVLHSFDVGSLPKNKNDHQN